MTAAACASCGGTDWTMLSRTGSTLTAGCAGCGAIEKHDAPKVRKYRNTPVEVDGQRFDSKAEAARWSDLRLMEMAGEILMLERQRRFVLIDAFTNDYTREKERAVSYVADFSYLDANGREVAEDVKGGPATMTALFKLKRKLFLRRYPAIRFVVTGGGDEK